MKMTSRKQQLKFWQGFKSPVAVAHRGGNGAGPEKESSLKSFQSAHKLGYKWFEVDVVATKDHKLIVSHGRGYQLRPNKDLPTRKKLQRMTLSEIRKEVKVGGEEVLLFEDLLDQFSDVKIFVDPKTYKSVPVLIKCMSGRPRDIDRICIGAFSKMRTLRVAYIIKKNTGKDVCTSILGPINAYPIYVAARLYLFRSFAKYYVQETNAGSIHVPYRWITNSPKAGKKLIQYAHGLGLKVAVYTPNSEKALKAILDSKTDIIMSDSTKLLMKLIQK
jgi:glycerophosphoryl diester phosphodiesterase